MFACLSAAAAFAHHPEQGQMDADDLAARMAEEDSGIEIESETDRIGVSVATGIGVGRL